MEILPNVRSPYPDDEGLDLIEDLLSQEPASAPLTGAEARGLRLDRSAEARQPATPVEARQHPAEARQPATPVDATVPS